MGVRRKTRVLFHRIVRPELRTSLEASEPARTCHLSTWGTFPYEHWADIMNCIGMGRSKN